MSLLNYSMGLYEMDPQNAHLVLIEMRGSTGHDASMTLLA